MSTVNELNRIKDRVENLRKERDKAAGALEQILSRLKREFGCDSLQEAKKLHVSLSKEATKAEGDYERLLVEFKTKHEEEA